METRIAVAVLLGALAGCQRGVELPPFDGHRAMLLDVEVVGARRELYAFGAEAAIGTLSIASGARDTPLRLRAYLYDHDLLGARRLTGGLVDPTISSCTEPPPAAEAALVASFDGGSFESWRATDEKTPAATIPLPCEIRDDPCLSRPKLSIRSLTLDSECGAQVALPLDERSVLVGTDDAMFFRVTREGSTPLTFTATDAAYTSTTCEGGLHFGGGLLEPGGTMLLARTDGRMVRAKVEGDAVGVEVLPHAPLEPAKGRSLTWWDHVAYLDGGGAPLEIFAVTTGGTLHRFDLATGWTKIWDPPSDPLRVHWPDRRRSIAWLGPGEVVTADWSPLIRWWKDGQADEYPLLDSETPITAVARLDGRGLLFAAGSQSRPATFHRLASKDAEAVRVLDQPGSNEPFASPTSVHAVTPLGAGLFYAGLYGHVGTHDGARGSCATNTEGHLFYIVPVSATELLVVGQRASTNAFGPTPVYWITLGGAE